MIMNPNLMTPDSSSAELQVMNPIGPQVPGNFRERYLDIVE